MASKLSAATSTSLTCHFLGQTAFLAWVAAEVPLQAAHLNQQQMQRKRKILRKSSKITYLRDFFPQEPPLLQPWVFLLLSLRPPFQLEDDSQPACKTATQTKGNAAQHAQANTFVAFLGSTLRTNSRPGVLALVVSVVRVASLQKVSQGTGPAQAPTSMLHLLQAVETERARLAVDVKTCVVSAACNLPLLAHNLPTTTAGQVKLYPSFFLQKLCILLNSSVAKLSQAPV